MRKVIAIDFDGCLCRNAWPEIGEPIWPVIEDALAEQRKGTALILWTCRSGALLDEAVAACAGWGLTFDAVNENLPERWGIYGTESRKVSADEYWDDRAVQMPIYISLAEEDNEPLTLEWENIGMCSRRCALQYRSLNSCVRDPLGCGRFAR